MAENNTLTEIRLLDYWRVIVRRKWIIGLFTVLVTGTATFTTVRQPKEYIATTVLHIDMAPPRVVDWDESATSQPRALEYQAFYNTQYQIINSRSVKSKSIEKLRQDYQITDWDNADDPVAAFSDGMIVTAVKDTRLVNIGYLHRDPGKAAIIANTIAAVYKDENIRRKIETAQNNEKWLSDQAQVYLERKKVSEQSLLEYRRKEGLLAFADKNDLVQKNLANIYDQYTQARSERIALENNFNLVMTLQKKGDTDALIAHFSTGTLNSLKDQYNQADSEYKSMSERYLPKYPSMLQLDAQRKSLSEKIQEELRRLIKGKEAEYMLAKSKEDALQAEFSQAKADAAAVEERLVRAQQLSNEVETNQRFYNSLNKRSVETDLVSLLKNSNIEVIDAATSPVYPSRPNVRLNVLLALVVGLGGGIAIAFGVEYLDKTFKSPDEVEAYLSMPLLGLLPELAVEGENFKRDTFVFRNPKSTIAECCRAIRTRIVHINPDRQIRTLLVTSGSPREGKSTVVVSLGTTMALANQRTLIVDTDLRKPRLHHAFGATLEKGLTSIIDHNMPYEDAISPTEVPNLFILPCGPIPANPAELLGSPRFRQVMQELQDRFDFIIYDSPPCIAVTDAVVLATRTDGVIFVIKQGSTTKDAAREAQRRLGDLGENLLGCVMNNVNIERDTYGYRYYYYHYYGEETA